MDLVCGNVSVTYITDNFMCKDRCVTLYPHPSPPLKNAGGTLQAKLKLIIMAKKEIGAKAPKLSLIGLIKAAGGEVSVKWEKLWSSPEIIAEGIEPSAIEVRVSSDYKDSIFAILYDGKESRLVPFAQDELDPENLKTDDDGIVIEGLEGLTFSLVEVTALEDRPDLGKAGIRKGDRHLKLYVE